MKGSMIASYAALLLLGISVTGCSGNTGEQSLMADKSADTAKPGGERSGKQPSTEPVTLRVNNWNTAFQQAEFDQYFAEPLRKKYPFLTLEYLDQQKGTSNTLDNLITAGNTPDIVFTDYPNLAGLLDYDYPEDLNRYVQDFSIDLKKVDPLVIEGAKTIGSKGELFALPVYSDRMMWFYNKDLFDKFGVPYPTDDMTWDDAIAAFKRLSRMEDGVQYASFRMINLPMTGSQWGVPLVDPKTGKASFQTDDWKKSLALMQQIAAIPGNTKLTNEDFYQKETLASLMQSFNIMVNLLEGVERKGHKIDWDVASLPQSKEKPGIAGANKPLYFMVSKSSKHKDQAFAAVSYLMASEEVQTTLSRNGKMSVLIDDGIVKQFGTKLDILKGRNVAAVYKHKMSALPYSNRFNRLALVEMIAAGNEVLNGTQDMNTALRNAEEKANKAIDAKIK
ncbi:extracellular solute-binding protein [Paenibacillus hemerocallicola]|uniref:Extracellular solute-binding protein n=1 Tax=Paenibacillus hemerocallicola TaxID=1172614 RepID=A0A5C4T9S9_9BACL|nr:extracellular solute-binding protein [Paenibacillus hemerocallicola]TNJ65834.1 extracellular solute-binding protein [Paenibacillus hemerocallicola]